MKLFIYKFSLLIMFLSFGECDEDLQDPSGIRTRVYGRMYDNQNQIPIVNQQLRISEYNRIPGSFYGETEFIQHLDSTVTDSNGYYDFSFETTGRGDKYELSFQFNTYLSLGGQKSRIEIENSEEDVELNFNFLHLYPVNLKITLDSDVEFLPIYINPQYPLYYPSSNNLTQTGIEIQRSIYTNKNLIQTVKFSRNKPDGKGQRFTYKIPATNSTSLTEYEINIKNDDFVDF